MALKPEERQLVAQLAISGEIVLHQKGWSREQCDDFLNRTDVQKELQSLDNVYKERDQVAERAKFFGMVEIQRMVPRAVQLLQRALLDGETVNGQVIVGPNEAQLDAALQVLDRSGVDAKKISKDMHGDGLAKITGNVTINNVSMGDGVAETSARTLMREKLRTRIAEMLHQQVKSVSGNIVEGSVEVKKSKKNAIRRLGNSSGDKAKRPSSEEDPI